MNAYRIKDWWQYEVTEKGHQASAETPIEKLRKRPLLYVRKPVSGHNLTPIWRQLTAAAYTAGRLREMACHGLFDKLLDLAASQDRQFRGWILDHKQQPMTAESINDLLNLSAPKLITECLEILCSQKVGLIELLEFPELSRNCREFPADPGRLYNETENESKVKKSKEQIKTTDSDLKNPDSDDSDSDPTEKTIDQLKSHRTEMQKFAFKLPAIIPVRTKSDKTCFVNIARHLFEIAKKQNSCDCFDKALEIARSPGTLGAENPAAYFVNECKKTFGFEKKESIFATK